jgi:hypothetical protein
MTPKNVVLIVLVGALSFMAVGAGIASAYWLHFRFPPQQAAQFDAAMIELFDEPPAWQTEADYSGCHPLIADWLPLAGPTSCAPLGRYSAQHWLIVYPADASDPAMTASLFDDAAASLPATHAGARLDAATRVPTQDGYGPTFDSQITFDDGTVRRFTCGYAEPEQVAAHRVYFEEHPHEAVGITCEMDISI